MRLRDALAPMLLMLAAGCAGTGETPRAGVGAERARLAEQNVALGQQYLEKGMHEIALQRLQEALRHDPRSADAHGLLGVLYERINRPKQAEEHYLRSVRFAPERGAILNNYGTWLCRSGRPAEADEWFARALADPFYRTPVAALANAGACAMLAGRAEQAEGYFRRVLELDPGHLDSLHQLTVLSYAKGDLLRARAFSQRRVAGGSLEPGVLELAARIEDGLGDNAAANRYRARLRTEFPEYRPTSSDPPRTP
jgi:type IV pilus assembly protein PilF